MPQKAAKLRLAVDDQESNAHATAPAATALHANGWFRSLPCCRLIGCGESPVPRFSLLLGAVVAVLLEILPVVRGDVPGHILAGETARLEFLDC